MTDRVEVLGRSKTPPFQIEDGIETSEDTRLRYRYLDLRRPEMMANMKLRSDFTFAIRTALHDRAFMEVETPALFKSTPEGARDFIVPSRLQPGSFYALPQSPQLLQAAAHGGRRRALLPGRQAASATRTCAPTASPSSRRWTSR